MQWEQDTVLYISISCWRVNLTSLLHSLTMISPFQFHRKLAHFEAVCVRGLQHHIFALKISCLLKNRERQNRQKIMNSSFNLKIHDEFKNLPIMDFLRENRKLHLFVCHVLQGMHFQGKEKFLDDASLYECAKLTLTLK